MPATAPLTFHHVGFVVESIAAAAPRFVSSLGASWDGEVVHDPLQKVRVSFLRNAGTKVQVELVEPAGNDSPVARFLRERTGGLHHLCFSCDQLESALAGQKQAGSLMVSRPKPAAAFGGRRIAWVLTTDKLLLELLETGGRHELT